MLTPDHVNGLTLDEYMLDAVRGDPRLEILKFNLSMEGESSLTADLCREIRKRHPALSQKDLVQHGFELAFCRKS